MRILKGWLARPSFSYGIFLTDRSSINHEMEAQVKLYNSLKYLFFYIDEFQQFLPGSNTHFSVNISNMASGSADGDN